MLQNIQSLSRDYFTEISIFLLAILLRVGYWLYKGSWRGGDGDAYEQACTIWANDPVGIITAHKGILYSGFTFPFCQVLSIPGATINTWVMIQITLSAFSCVVIYRTGKHLIDETAGVIAGFGLAILWDTWLWTTLTYSTAMLTFAMVCCLWAFSRYHHSGSRRSKIALFSALGFLGITHPMGLPIVAGWILYEINPGFATDSRPIFNSRLIPVGAGLLSAGLFAYAIERYGLLSRISTGMVIYNDPTYALPIQEAPTFVDFIVTNHIYILAVPVARVLMFFAPFLPRNSTARIVLNLVTYTPILIIASYGAYKSWNDRRDLFRYLVVPAIMLLMVTAVYIVSWDLRYRAVLGPSMVLLTGYVVSDHLTTTTPRDYVDTLLKRLRLNN